MKALNDDIQMRSDWFLPLCTGPERLRNHHGLKLHPTQKPEALLHRVLLASTVPGDIVLDPFIGTGTTAVVAKRLHRHFIGIERHPAYVEAALGRMRTTRPAPEEGLSGAISKRDVPRVPFGVWLSAGCCRRGPSCSTACAGSVPLWPPMAQWWPAPSRLNPQGGGDGPERSGLQWLDLLALRTGRATGAA